MKHIRFLFPFCLILSACAVLITNVTTKTSAARSQQQIAQREEELAKVFRKSELVKLDTRLVAGRVRETGQVSFQAAGKAYELVLMPNDLRAKDYHAEETLADGTRRAVESGAVRTYKGFVRGFEDSHARFTIDEQTFEGMLLIQGANYFIEPAGKFSLAAERDDFVLYDERDVIAGAGVSCEVPMPEKISAKAAELAPRVAGGFLYRVVEIATEADAPFMATFNNDTSAANADILGTLNQVEGVYQIDLNLTFSITYQHSWVGTDPYGAPASIGLLLTSTAPNAPTFQNIWNTNFPHTNPQFRRDIAHMWTNRFPGQGRAFVSTACANPTSAYGITGKFDFVPNKYILAAHEIAHNLGANHWGPVVGTPIPAGCADTIMIDVSNQFTSFRFCAVSKAEIANHFNGPVTGSCLSLQTAHTRFDFDGDAKADLSVFRPNGSFWYIIGSETGGFTGQAFGTQGDIIAPEDYDGDGRTDLGVYRPSAGSWYLMQSRAGFAGVQFGTQGDIPVAEDYDGDSKADIALYRPSTGAWYILNSNGNTVSSYFFGIQGDLPAPADFDADGKADIAVFRPSQGTWYIQQSLLGFRAEAFGANGDRPTPADFDGDDKADLAIFRPSTGSWYIQQSGAGFRGQLFGNSLDVPVAADYDGDRRADIAVWRTTTGEWYILNSSNGSIRGQAFGTIGDRPVPAAYVP